MESEGNKEKKTKKGSKKRKKEEEEKKKLEIETETGLHKLFVILIVIILICVSVISSYYYFYFREEDDSEEKPNQNPVAKAGGSIEVYTFELIKFTGDDSYDPDGEIVSYYWDFGDGTFSSEKSPEHSYSIIGLFLLTLTVEDNEGGISEDTAYIKVKNRIPQIEIDVPTEVTAFQITRFNGSGFDKDGFIVLYEWDFDGDGIYDWNAKTTGITTYFYEDVGVYNASFRITDNNDDKNITEIQITVTPFPNNPPTANAGSDQIVGAGTVSLFGTASDPDGNIILFEWDFDGNGEFDWVSKDSGSANHTYNIEGTYSAVFKVTDAFGLSSSDVVNITIDNKILTENIGASVKLQWNATKGTDSYYYIIQFNNSITSGNVSVVITELPSGESEKLTYPSKLSLIDNLTMLAHSSLIPTLNERIKVEVFYLGYIIGQREITTISASSQRLINHPYDQTVLYKSSTDLKVDLGQTIKEEIHTGTLKVVQNSLMLSKYYEGEGRLKLINELEDSETVLNTTSSKIYDNETWYSDRLIQESFEFRGTGNYKFSSESGASFDVNLDEFVIKEQNGNRTDFHFSGSGIYKNPPVSGTIDLSYNLLGIDEHDNYKGETFSCEKYKVETLIEYTTSNIKFEFHNISFLWVVAERSDYENTTIYFSYIYRYSENDTVLEQISGEYYPENSPRAESHVSDIFDAIDFEGPIPMSYLEADSVIINSKTGLTISYTGMKEYMEVVDQYTYSVTEVYGEVAEKGAGTSTFLVVNKGKYTGWILSKYEEYSWKSDRLKRSIELIN